MAIRDIFKKKPKDYNQPTTLPSKGQAPKPAEEIKKEATAAPKRAPRKTAVGKAYRVLKTPQVTEKATGLVGQNQYVFKVWPRANKVETKKAIEDLYGVDVISVKIIKVPRKRRKLGRISGWRKGYKKAIVKIKEGQKIEVLPR